jgi:hypothetical protein
MYTLRSTDILDDVFDINQWTDNEDFVSSSHV